MTIRRKHREAILDGNVHTTSFSQATLGGSDRSTFGTKKSISIAGLPTISLCPRRPPPPPAPPAPPPPPTNYTIPPHTTLHYSTLPSTPDPKEKEDKVEHCS